MESGKIIKTMKKSVLQEKSLAFAVRIVKFYRYLCEEKKEFVLSKQILRSGTAIGANARESQNAQSQADFITKLTIALKEADETQYWLELMDLSGVISHEEYVSLSNDLSELVAMLIASIKTIKGKTAEINGAITPFSANKSKNGRVI